MYMVMCLPIQRANVSSEAQWSRQVQCKSPLRMLQRLETFCASATFMEVFSFVHEWLHLFRMDAMVLQMSKDYASSTTTGQYRVAHISGYCKSRHTVVLAWDPSH